MIVIDRTKCVSCGACATMTLTFTCLQSTGDYELYVRMSSTFFLGMVSKFFFKR